MVFQRGFPKGEIGESIVTTREDYIHDARPSPIPKKEDVKKDPNEDRGPEKIRYIEEKCDILFSTNRFSQMNKTVPEPFFNGVELKCEGYYNTGFVAAVKEDMEMVYVPTIKKEYQPCTMWSFAISMSGDAEGKLDKIKNDGKITVYKKGLTVSLTKFPICSGKTKVPDRADNKIPLKDETYQMCLWQVTLQRT